MMRHPARRFFFAAAAAAALLTVRGAGDPFADLPANAAPETVSRRLTDQLLRTRPEKYCPPGYKGNGYYDKGYGNGVFVSYAVCSLWANAIACARLTLDTDREERLIRLYDDFLPGGAKHKLCPTPYHVDDTVFGVIAYEIFLQNGDKRYLAEGARYADTQWTAPCEKTIRARHAAPAEVQRDYWARGFTPQTRLWIDDMYMIIAIQSQAYRATGNRAYIERAAKEMCFYLDELQLKSGPAKGLFYHAPDVPFVWGRGDGWMAAAMAMVLRFLPEDSPSHPRILAGYRLMMEALLRYQRPDGKWSQLVDAPDDPRNWAESSCSAMFTYAFITGVRHGYLKRRIYAPAARKAWIQLCNSLDEHGNLPQTCCGTGKKNDRQYYFDRIRSHGDPHGQAPMLWCAAALLDKGRVERIAPPPMGHLQVYPTFCSSGWHWTCGYEVKDLKAEYRKVGETAWRTGLTPEYFPETRSTRSSLVNLEEDTCYELKLVADLKTYASTAFRTWKSDVPVARTVEIDPAAFSAPYRITAKGTSDGWIRYVVKGGRLDVSEEKTCFVLDGAKYVILEGMTIRARPGAQHVIELNRTRDVRIRNCDISGWGPVGKPDYLGKLHGKLSDGKMRGWRDYIDLTGAVNIGRGSVNTVVERCYIHDPAARANSWRYSHPAGPQAVIADHAGPGTVIRYNDFVGSDSHRWNDAVEGPGNFDPDGGLNRDADVYGNFMIFSNDDNVELDGGQQNVRCFRNRFEGGYSGVSVQGCMAGPSYVFENAVTGTEDEFALGGYPFKTVNTSPFGDLAVTAIFDNEVYLPYREGFVKDQNTRLTVSGNRFHPERATFVSQPVRPIPYVLDISRIDGVRVTGGAASPASVAVTAKVGGTGYAEPFEVAVNAAFPWLRVSPTRGVLKSGEKTVFTVTFDAAAMANRRDWRGAFLVRTADGFSRPVSVYAESDYEVPARVDAGRGIAIYAEAVGGSKGFDLPKTGSYCILVRVREKPGVRRTEGVTLATVGASLDGGEEKTYVLKARPHWTWQLLGGRLSYEVFTLRDGSHTISLSDGSCGKVEIGPLVVTDRPEIFEPR